jgi:hypothetical protein
MLSFALSWADEDDISTLLDKISTLEKQQNKLETEKQKLVAESDELSYAIEALKMHADSGLGIIGRYRLSRNLRKAQTLSEKIQALEKDIYEIEEQLEGYRTRLKAEYESQINILLERLEQLDQADESRELLAKLKEYQSAKDQLVKSEKDEIEYLEITQIRIEKYDGPQEIREKADLIRDSASRIDMGIQRLTSRIEDLKDELKTRKKLGEFVEEISFFEERISKEEIVAENEPNDDKQPVSDPIEPINEPVLSEPNRGDEPTVVDASEPDSVGSGGGSDQVISRPIIDFPIRNTEPPAKTADIPATDTGTPDTITEVPPMTEVEQTTLTSDTTEPGKIILERDGISINFAGASISQIEQAIRLMEKQKQELQKELASISEKADLFYKKADEIEKTETETGEKNR